MDVKKKKHLKVKVKTSWKSKTENKKNVYKNTKLYLIAN